jgi:hypothetical protein
MKSILLAFLLVSFAFAEFLPQLDSVSRDMIFTLGIPKDGAYSFSATDKDENYLLPVTPLYSILEKNIRTHNRKFMIRPVGGDNQRIVQSLYIKAQEGGYRNVELGQGSVDSLIIGAKIFLGKEGDMSVQFIVCDLGGNVRYQSGKLFATAKGAERRQLMEIFESVEDPLDLECVRYREKVISALNEQMLRDSLMTSGNNVFAYDKKWTYANMRQVDVVDMILRTKYGFRFDPQASDRIEVNRDGGLLFIKSGKRLEIANLIDVEPIVADNAEFALDSIAVPVDEVGDKYDRIPVRSKETSVFQKIKYTIEKTLADAYNKPDFDYLDGVFECSGKCILRGQIKADVKKGKESVAYYWDTKEDYIAGLKKLVSESRLKFDVDLKVMNIYQDPSLTRYWAVARQVWRTRNSKGAQVYRDDGFLVINFDFSEGLNQQPKFKIFYRIWIYDYRFDIPELRISRTQQIERDFNGVFFPGASNKMGGVGFFEKRGKDYLPTSNDMTVGGITDTLKRIIREDLMTAVKMHNKQLLK